MDRFDIIAMLRDLNIEFTLTEHPPAETVEDIDSFGLAQAESIVKNLFLRDERKKNYYLLLAGKEKTVNLKALRSQLGLRPLSFASEADLFTYLGLKKGSVTPFGILNGTAGNVQVLVDSDVLAYPVVGVHPNENTATLWLAPHDLKTVIERQGNAFRPVTL